jgi:hypothetical protein
MTHAINLAFVCFKTSILIGVHGAGLMLASLLPPHAVLVEVRAVDKPGHHHFENVAVYSQRHYLALHQSNYDDMAVEVDAEQLADAARRALTLLRQD